MELRLAAAARAALRALCGGRVCDAPAAGFLRLVAFATGAQWKLCTPDSIPFSTYPPYLLAAIHN